MLLLTPLVSQTNRRAKDQNEIQVQLKRGQGTNLPIAIMHHTVLNFSRRFEQWSLITLHIVSYSHVLYVTHLIC